MEEKTRGRLRPNLLLFPVSVSVIPPHISTSRLRAELPLHSK